MAQRAAAALRADSDRCSELSLAARAGPPFRPPRRPSSTAAGFFSSSGRSAVSTLPVTEQGAVRFNGQAYELAGWTGEPVT